VCGQLAMAAVSVTVSVFAAVAQLLLDACRSISAAHGVPTAASPLHATAAVNRLDRYQTVT